MSTVTNNPAFNALHKHVPIGYEAAAHRIVDDLETGKMKVDNMSLGDINILSKMYENEALRHKSKWGKNLNKHATLRSARNKAENQVRRYSGINGPLQQENNRTFFQKLFRRKPTLYKKGATYKKAKEAKKTRNNNLKAAQNEMEKHAYLPSKLKFHENAVNYYDESVNILSALRKQQEKKASKASKAGTKRAARR